MTDADRAALRDELRVDEGQRLMPYKDTLGLITIGVGRCLDTRGITADECALMLENDITAVLKALEKSYAWFSGLDGPRQRAVANLAFNLGVGGLSAFKKFLAAMARTDYEDAATELRSSLWYQQVGLRGPRIVAVIRGGLERAA